MLLFTAMAEKNSYDPETIKTAIIEKGTHQGLQGDIMIDNYGDAKRTLYHYVIKNGQFKKVD